PMEHGDLSNTPDIRKVLSIESIKSNDLLELEQKQLVDEKKKSKEKKKSSSKTIMNWEALHTFPWDIILLFGGGFALAAGVKNSGLANIVAEQLRGLSAIPSAIICLVVCVLVCLVSSKLFFFAD